MNANVFPVQGTGGVQTGGAVTSSRPHEFCIWQKVFPDVKYVFSWCLLKYDRDVLPNLPVFPSSELDEEAKALLALLSTVGKPVVSIHCGRRLFSL